MSATDSTTPDDGTHAAAHGDTQPDASPADTAKVADAGDVSQGIGDRASDGDSTEGPAPGDAPLLDPPLVDASQTAPTEKSKFKRITGFFYPGDGKKPKKAKLRWSGGPGASRGQDKNNLD